LPARHVYLKKHEVENFIASHPGLSLAEIEQLIGSKCRGTIARLIKQGRIVNINHRYYSSYEKT
jgi:hypothetical protein